MATPSSSYLPFEGNFIDALLSGTYWILDSSRTINWSISDGFNGEYWTNPDYMIEQIDIMFNIIGSYIDVTFQYVGYFDNPESADSWNSDINYSWDSGYFINNNNVWAQANWPAASEETDYWGQPGDIFLNLNSRANTLDYEPGGAGFALLLHETGHALGLKHPHDSGGTGSPTLDDFGMGDMDIEYVSLMSYNETYGWDSFTYEPMTPMLYDVIGLQSLYGERTNNHSDDTTWSVGEYFSYSTIYDTGGYDTIQVNDGNGWLVDLDGGFMLSNTAYTMMWLMGDFELVRGSSYSDEFIGDEFDNVFIGGYGSDIIDGGRGTDIAVYNYYPSDYDIVVYDNYTTIKGKESNDMLYNIETLYFADEVFYPISDFGGEVLIPESAAPFFIDPDELLANNDINTGDGWIIQADAAQLYRVYMGAMGRLPDDAGFKWWFEKIEAGGRQAIFEMAEGFIHSPEFKGYADTNNDNQISNDEFVTHMYEGVFGRSPDQEGYDFWLEKLELHNYNQRQVLVYMTESNEYVEQTLEVVAEYIFI